MSVNSVCNFAAAATPMTPQGQLDESALATYLRFLSNKNIGVCLAPFLNGEGLSLDEAEIGRVYEIAVRELKGGVPIVAAALGYSSTATVIKRALVAAKTGVDCVQIYPPRPWPMTSVSPSAEMFERFYRDVCEAVNSSLVIGLQSENCPDQEFPLALIEKFLKDYPHIVAINCTAKSERQLVHLVQSFGSMVPIRCTSIKMLWAGLASGVVGSVSPEANVCPDWVNSAVRLFLSGERQKSQEIISKIRSLEVWWRKYPVSAQKGALQILGLMSNEVRRPYLPLSAQLMGKLKRDLQSLGLLSEHPASVQ